MKQGLYDAASEHDACGIGMVVNIRGDKTHELPTPGGVRLCNEAFVNYVENVLGFQLQL